MTPIVLMAAIGVAVGLVIQYFSAEPTMRRAMAAALPVAIAQARAGSVVKLTGRVVHLTAPVLAPISGRPCACYLVNVEQNQADGGSGTWMTVLRDSGGDDFLIEDGTGRARVVTQSVNVLAVNTAKRASGTLNDPTPQQRAYHAKHIQPTSGAVLDRSLRYQEAVFEEGDTVTVVGVVGFERDPGGVPDGSSYREAPQRAVIAAPPGGSLLVSDDPSLAGVARSLAR